MNLGSFVISRLERKPTLAKRSPKWRTVRKKWLATHNTCATCGRNKNLEVHHLLPYHLYPDLELDSSNFITLCEGVGRNCHYAYGHYWDWTKYNDTLRQDAADILHRILNAPGGIGE